MKPLDGVDVVSLGQIYNGPYCSLLLAFLGANVVKVEPPGGERIRKRDDNGMTPEAVMLNSSKQGITLDLKSEQGTKLFKKLIEDADVVIENFSVGVMDRLGLGYETLSDINPELIFAHGSGYGDTGPYAEYPAMDLTVQSMAGIVDSTGFPDGPPVKSGAPIADFMGGLSLAGAILAALYQRERTGEGQYVEVAMFDAVYPTLTSALAATYRETTTPPRTGNRHSGLAVCPYNIYPTSDGYIAIFCVSERHWNRLAEIVNKGRLQGDPRYDSNAKRVEHMEEVDELITSWTVERGRDEIADRLLEAGVPCGPVKTVDEVSTDPHLVERGMIFELDHPHFGIISVPGCPLRLDGMDDLEIQPAPLAGEHNEEVYRTRLGLSSREYNKLQEQGII